MVKSRLIAKVNGQSAAKHRQYFLSSKEIDEYLRCAVHRLDVGWRLEALKL